jgi:hypothetical protein
MRFRSELLQPPKGGSEATLKTIYNVYMTPDGRIDGGDKDTNTAVEHSNARMGNSEDAK